MRRYNEAVDSDGSHIVELIANAAFFNHENYFLTLLADYNSEVVLRYKDEAIDLLMTRYDMDEEIAVEIVSSTIARYLNKYGGVLPN